MNNQYLNPPGIAKATGYSQVVVTDARKTIYISGQIGLTPEGVVQQGLRAQTVQAFENLKTALASAGATFDNVVKMTTLIVNFKSEDRMIIREVRAQYLSATQPPASTLIGVQALAAPEWLIEIEAIAVID
ncbi:MAG: RidA family protein [Anaerolineae bacterium]|nr:RidA family protein [Anaerolineae bacterium]